ncbi:eukaryotic translation initiation factor 4E type 3-A [Cucurbitaria berberidis CBS 394.84]|uniref:Eukaryotic translation initiation factor 4E type 3-A n=1 Tax=Cucurbitaria berberidis CBS 394.84 TaxID=1168544 RepID=A0A9P4GIN1_9PLEO|nr:eukaryotic translation initiation factor 4E type 3-A [Cucurbitaria berberidis CBS 394.84]KAF1846883.1 eukaryotic translation initiation factor 4E type 3-A [Cucurbitaria berberidis CBS 394.84]
MTESARLISMLRASAVHKANCDKPLDYGYSPCATTSQVPQVETAPIRLKVIPVSLLEGLIHASKHGVPRPNQPLSVDFKVGLDQILNTLNTTFSRDASVVVPSKETAHDLVNDLAIENCKRIFVVRSSTTQLENIANNLGIALLSPTMAGRFPVLSTSDLPRASAEEQAATASPARGTAMLNSIFKSVRVPEFRFKWLFWAEKGQQSTPKDKAANSEEYSSRPKPLGEQIISVREFYQHFNNIPVESLKLRDSIHLFHLGIKPVWEDPRNARGGAWYFKVSKELAAQFWHEMCLLAVGDILQSAVETKRDSFNDDICGITYSVRWNAVQIAVWNRDAENVAGREKLLAIILDKLSPELQPKKEDSYWYKPHKEHKGFVEQQ